MSMESHHCLKRLLNAVPTGWNIINTVAVDPM